MAYQYFNYKNSSRSCCTPYKSIVIWTCFSTILCLTILALSLVDLGRASYGLNIALPILTVTYHLTIFLSHRRFEDAVNDGTLSEDTYHPMTTTKALVCVYTLLVLWIVPIVLMNVTSVNSDHNATFSNFFHANQGTKIAQTSLDSTEVGMLTPIAITSTCLRIATERVRAKSAAGGLPSVKC